MPNPPQFTTKIIPENKEGRAFDDASPHDILLHLMEENDLKQADLVGTLGSRGIVSEVVNGKRQISRSAKIKLKPLAISFMLMWACLSEN